MCDKYLECDYCLYDNNCDVQINGTEEECAKKFFCNAPECNDILCIPEGEKI